MKYLVSILLVCFFSSPAFAQKEIKYAAVVENGWWQVIDNRGTVIVDSLARSGYSNYVNENSLKSSTGLFPYVREGKYGFKDYKNDVVVLCTYKYVFPFVNGCAKAGTDSLWHLINANGKVIASSDTYDYASDASEEGLVVVRKGEDIACINTDGETVIPFYYKTDIKFYPYPQFEGGLLRVMVKQPKVEPDSVTRIHWLDYSSHHFKKHHFKIGFIDSRGKLVIDTVYQLKDAIIDYRDRQSSGFRSGACGTGMALAEKFERLQDTADRFILANEYYRFEGGICLVNVDGINLVINTKGDSLFTLNADRGIRCSQGYVLIESSYYSDLLRKTSYSTAIINSIGNSLYKGSGKISENKWVKDAGMVIEVMVNNEISSSRYRGGVYKLLNTESGILVKDSFLMVKHFVGAFAQVLPFGKNARDKKDWLIIDRHNNVLPLWTNGIVEINDRGDKNIIAAEAPDGKKGYINRSFKWLIEPIFEDGAIFSEELAAVKMSGSKWGYINKKGKVVIPAQYDEVIPFRSLKIN